VTVMWELGPKRPLSHAAAFSKADLTRALILNETHCFWFGGLKKAIYYSYDFR
jgi:hypothetical protein